jgi:hypothetical protein
LNGDPPHPHKYIATPALGLGVVDLTPALVGPLLGDLLDAGNEALAKSSMGPAS